MTKREYHSWSPLEEANLQEWVDEHPELSWEARAVEYSTKSTKKRSSESLRSKYGQLCKGIRRCRPSHDRLPSSYRRTAKQARHRQQRVSNGPVSIVIPTPVLMKARSTKMQAKWQRVLKCISSRRPQAHPTHQLPQPRVAHPEQPVTTSPGNQVENHSHYQSPVRLCRGNTSQGLGPKKFRQPLSQPQEQPRAMSPLWQLVYRMANRSRRPAVS